MSSKKIAKIVNILKVAKDTYEVSLKPDSKISFLPGQYITITLPELSHLPTVEQFRDMSISSAPSDECLKIAFRNSNSKFKQTMLSYTAGDKLEIEGPGGIFHIKNSQNSIAVAGGIGITPFLSHVRSGKKFPIFYYNSNQESEAFTSELRNKLNTDLILKHGKPKKDDFAEYKNKHWYIAGPPAMVTSVRTLLKSLMVSDNMITTEEFAGYEQI